MTHKLSRTLLSLSMLVTASACAADGYATGNVYLRAGTVQAIRASPCWIPALRLRSKGASTAGRGVTWTLAATAVGCREPSCKTTIVANA